MPSQSAEQLKRRLADTKQLAEQLKDPPQKSILCTYDDKKTYPKTPVANDKCQVQFLNEDSITAFKELKNQNYRPLLMNMANRFSIGGGCEEGKFAQEESLFYRSNYYQSLYNQGTQQGARYKYKQAIPHNAAYYTEGITVLCNEKNVVLQDNDRFKMDCLAIAGYDLGKYKYDDPPTDTYKSNGEEERKLFEAYQQDKQNILKNVAEATAFPNLKALFTAYTKNKIKLMLQVAAEKNHDSLVLGALSCGAFKLKVNINGTEYPTDKAWTVNCVADAYEQAFKEALEEGLLNKFKVISFAVFSEARDDVNVKKFQKLAPKLQQLINESQLVFTDQQDIIKKYNWTDFKDEQENFIFKGVITPEENKDFKSIGSIVNKNKQDEILINIKEDCLECPLGTDQKPKELQEQALIEVIKKIVDSDHKNPSDPLIFAINNAFTVECLSKIIELLLTKQLPVKFEVSKDNVPEISNILNEYNKNFENLAKSTAQSKQCKR